MMTAIQKLSRLISRCKPKAAGGGLAAVLFWSLLLPGPAMAADCGDGVCLLPRNCEAEKLTPEECAAEHERAPRSRGAVQDKSRIISPPLGAETYPPNTEALLPDEKFTLWLQDESLFKPGLDDDVLYNKRLVRDVETVKLTGQVPGLSFEAGSSDIPPELIDKLRTVLSSMQGRENVRLHFIGHTDNAPLTGSLRAQHGDNTGLSAARAQMAAEFFQRELGLEPAAVSFEGRGEREPIASNDSAEGRARNRRVEVEVWYDEVKEEREIEQTIEVEQASLTRINVCRVMQRCIYRRLAGNYARIQMMNAVEPLRYEGVQLEVTAALIEQVRRALDEVRDMPNPGIRVVAHTDNQPLTGAPLRIYGDNLNLSKALANHVASVLQGELGLRSSAAQSIGKGETAPLASNTTPAGRMLNRRIEIEIWHDDPRGGEASEPQPCPGSADAERITARFEDETPLVPFKQGQPVYQPGFLQRVQRILDSLKDKGNVRINFVGHTTNERLSRRAAVVYGDHFALSEERAKRVMDYVRQELKLGSQQVKAEGRGFLEPLNKPDDSPFAKKEFTVITEVNDGTLANPADARVELEFLYDDLAVTEEDPNVDIVPITQDEQPVSPFALHPIRVTVDGAPLDQGRRHGADIQRCTDIELDKSSIRLSYDRMRQSPRLNVHAVPSTIAVQDDPDTASVMENKVAFQAYTNYPAFIKRAEVRLFKADQSLQSEPLEILPLNVDSYIEWSWQPDVIPFEGPVQELKYLLRVYDAEGRFDETHAKALWVVSKLKDPAALQLMDLEAERRVAYGENHLALHNIISAGGTITVNGLNVPAGYTVWVLNQRVPVALNGEFVGEFIIPAGLHSVEVAVLDDKGNGRLYLRDLQMKSGDWFKVGIADLTLGVDDTTGPARLVTGDETHYENGSWADGRLAFYTKGKTEGGYTITASVDTQEEPLEDMFKNLDRKDPDAVFRRLDPDYYYPTYGDDSTTIDDAPTSGKFYVKAEKNKSHAMWGNFETRLLDTDLARIDRALYGADVRYESLDGTGYGESRMYAEAFVAEPGTLLAREEFRGTGGSLYFLQRRDITQGSDRLVIEVRDKDSGIVLQTMTLVYGQDYDIDYIQGRVLLTQPLSSTADDNLLVRNGALSGNLVFLVARYEYTPGFEEVEDTAVGGRIARWFGDTVKVGATFGAQDQLDAENNLSGVDVTVRKSPHTYVKVEGAATEGQPFAQSSSSDGGFQFSTFQPTVDAEERAAAMRVEAVAQLSDLHEGMNGQVRAYTQNREAGFASPGQLTNTDIVQSGISADVPVGERWQVHGKLDQREQENALSTAATEVDVRYRLTEHWRLSSGVRADEREDDSAIVPLTQVEGKRTDLAFEAAYDSLASWSAYGFVQNTLETTETRPENNRGGVGGAYQISDRTRLNAEASGGDGGSGGRLGVDYLATDRTNLYLAYNLEHERSDTGVRGRNGRSTAGFRTRYSDTTSVYGEERLSFGDQPAGLTHAYGIDYAPVDRWTFGLSLEAGTLEDNETAAQTERTAYGLTAGYNGTGLKYATAIELREDATELAERNTYLLKNTLSLQLTPDWRTLAKLNLAESESSQGEFYDGNFTEFVLGYGYRPVAHDRLNMLIKYTFFENLPAAEQLGVTGTRADFIQRSNIVALDVTYDLTQRWTLGTKLAQRLGEVALERADPQFFENNANLYILRADWNIVRNWDWLIEARALEVEQAEDLRSGFLTAGYWHLNDNIKLGAGYNFTDFSDDLTDLDFDSQGFFINIIGKM